MYKGVAVMRACALPMPHWESYLEGRPVATGYNAAAMRSLFEVFAGVRHGRLKHPKQQRGALGTLYQGLVCLPSSCICIEDPATPLVRGGPISVT